MGFGTPVPLLIGIVLILLGVGLFFLDNFKPGYKRDSDTVYSILLLTVGILSLLIWNAGFAEALQLMVSAGTIIALMIERIQNRSASNAPLNQSRNSSIPPRDGGRGSRGYRDRDPYEDDIRSDVRAEFEDEYIPVPPEPIGARRIRGSREGRGSSRDTYGRDTYVDEGYVDQLVDDTDTGSRRSGRRSSGRSYEDEGQYGSMDRSSRRPLQLEGDGMGGSSSASSGYTEDYPSEYSTPEYPTEVESFSNRRRSRSGDVLPSDDEFPSNSRSKRRRARRNGTDRPTDGDYVDYKPLNPSGYPGGSNDEMDNSSNFDDDPDFR